MGKQNEGAKAPTVGDLRALLASADPELADRVRAFVAARTQRQNAGAVTDESSSIRLRRWEAACDVEDRAAYDLAIFVAHLFWGAP